MQIVKKYSGKSFHFLHRFCWVVRIRINRYFLLCWLLTQLKCFFDLGWVQKYMTCPVWPLLQFVARKAAFVERRCLILCGGQKEQLSEHWSYLKGVKESHLHVLLALATSMLSFTECDYSPQWINPSWWGVSGQRKWNTKSILHGLCILAVSTIVH